MTTGPVGLAACARESRGHRPSGPESEFQALLGLDLDELAFAELRPAYALDGEHVHPLLLGDAARIVAVKFSRVTEHSQFGEFPLDAAVGLAETSGLGRERAHACACARASVMGGPAKGPSLGPLNFAPSRFGARVRQTDTQAVTTASIPPGGEPSNGGLPRDMLRPWSIDYLDTTGRADRISGGVRMIPVSTPAGEFRVWTKRVGSKP
jgi:hypothetical protein